MSKIAQARALAAARCNAAEVAAALGWTLYRARYVLRHGCWPWRAAANSQRRCA